MHEFSIVSHLLELLEKEAQQHQAVAISRVRIKIGVLSGVVPQLLREAFETIRRGTIAEQALLEIVEQEILIRCPCGYQGGIKETYFRCPKCSGSQIQVYDGEDLILLQTELEIP